MLTLQMLKAMPPQTVFAKGIVPNSPDGIYMTNTRKGDNLMWVAQRGNMHDWTIYCHWGENGEAFILQNGDKVFDVKNIKKLVPCDDEAYEMYRF